MTVDVKCAVQGLLEVVQSAALPSDAFEKVAGWCAKRGITSLQGVTAWIDDLCSELRFKTLEKKRFKKAVSAALEGSGGAVSSGEHQKALVVPKADVVKVLNLKMVQPPRNHVRKQRFVCRLAPVMESSEEYEDTDDN